MTLLSETNDQRQQTATGIMVKYANKYFLMDNFRKLLLFLTNGAQWCLKFQQQLCTQPGSRRLVWHGGHAHVAKCCFHRGIYIISKTPWSPVSTKRLSLVFTANVGVRGQFLWSVGHGGDIEGHGHCLFENHMFNNVSLLSLLARANTSAK